jgi:hypothetical protein
MLNNDTRRCAELLFSTAMADMPLTSTQKRPHFSAQAIIDKLERSKVDCKRKRFGKKDNKPRAIGDFLQDGIASSGLSPNRRGELKTTKEVHAITQISQGKIPSSLSLPMTGRSFEGSQHGDIECKVGRASSGSSTIYPVEHETCKEIRSSIEISQEAYPSFLSLPLGYFEGSQIYRNSVGNNELLEDGHLSIFNLIPPGCQRVVITSMMPPSPEWLKSLFADHRQTLSHLAILHQGSSKIGEAKMTAIRHNWNFVSCQPHTGGCLHSKLLIFRTADGLRVVVSGNNFYKYQWENDRDCMWVQDFRVTLHCAAGNNRFGGQLASFLNDQCQCKEGMDQQWINQHIEAILADIDLSVSRASLVYSFPRSKVESADRGGWRQLASIVNDLVALDYDTDTEEEESIAASSQVLYAMSGSMGDLDPKFLQTMRSAMMGQDILSISDCWQDVHNCQVLIPSEETSKIINPIWNGRSIGSEHWKIGVPEDAKWRFFNDAIPNPTSKATRNPFSHAKVIYSRPARRGGRAVLYVGSHNFSKTAWGVEGIMPKSVELGVVLSTDDPIIQEKWEKRLPYVLPEHQLRSDSTYKPAFRGYKEKLSNPSHNWERSQKLFQWETLPIFVEE